MAPMLTTALLISGPVLAMLAGAGATHWWHTRKSRAAKAWPTAFSLTARPLFTTEERLMFRELRTALPNHVVLAKINLLRFCQSTRDADARQWFERLHPLTVSFVVCTPNGTVISAIDLDAPNRAISARSQRLKEATLDACRVRYVRCQSGHRPDVASLAQWALGAANTIQSQAELSPLKQARAELAEKLQRRRTERASRSKDSVFHDSTFSDSFFALDSRFDVATASAANSAPAPLDPLSATDHGGRVAAAGAR
jgi:Protein of unknown function (DUF2726)